MNTAEKLVALMGLDLTATKQEYLLGKQEGEKPSGLFNRVSEWFGIRRAAELKKFETMTRQRSRRADFDGMFRYVSGKHADIPRSIRRSIARDMLKRDRLQKAA